MTNKVRTTEKANRNNNTTRILPTLLLVASLLTGSISAWAANYVFMYKDGNTYHILSNNNNTITDVLTFSYTNCVWSGTSGSTFSNQGRYLYWTDYNVVWTANTYGDDLTINNNRIYNIYNRNNVYIRYNNGSWVSSTTNSQNQVVYSLSGPATASWATAVSITGNQTTFTDLGSFTYSASATYNSAYYTLTGNGTYYVVEGGTPSGTAPSSVTDGITYTWSFNDGTNDNGHARINASTGEVTYYSAYTDNNHNETIKVTATVSGLSSTTATKSITFNKMTAVAPSSITATDVTVVKDNTITVSNYVVDATGLTAGQYVYNYVTATSGNTTIATVTNSNGTFTITGVEEGTAVITITAYDTDKTTPACSTTFTVTVEGVQTGVSNGTVILNDYEDHTWTYYSGVDASVDGGNYNTNYLGKLYSPNPRNVKITYKANGGAVSIDESETEFVYYKTLEQGTTAGQYPYTVISNPFSKRPTGKGFGGWKITGGASYISGHSLNDVLDLDEELTFIGLDDNYTPNCTSAEIELTATWVNLNNIVRRTNTDNYTYSATGGTYETNILVIQSNHNGTITASSPVTIMMVEPDGSADYRGSYTITGAVTPNNDGVTKIEFAHWNPGAAINPTGRSFTIGRGMAMNGTRRALYGTNTQRAMNQILKVESGNFSTFTSYNATPSSITKHWVIFGCDYDRAKGDNDNLTFTGKFLTATNRNLGLTSTGEMARVWSKSGSFMTGVDVADAAANNSYYIGVTSTHNYGHRYLEIQGGEWYANIAGGMGEGHTATAPGFTFRMKGGIIRGSVYGAAAYAGAGGTRTYVITGGSIGGWVAGGANGTQSNGGLLSGATYIYVGGKARVDSKGSTSVINRAVGGNVFGAGCGYGTSSNSGEITLGTNVVVADEAYIERGVYGGGSYGFCNTGQTSNIYITGGTVDGKSGGVSGTTYQASITGGVFGGACQNKGGTVNIYMNGGLVGGGVYGGSNANGTISGNVTMNIHGGQVGTSSANANIHGGGFGSATRVSQNVDITLGSSGQTEPGVTVYGDVYGGSALGYVNGTEATTTYHTNVTMNKGVINGSLYGGGLGNAGNAANVYGPVAVKVYGGTINTTTADGSGAVYGCNNINGAPQRTVTVDIYGTDPAPSSDTYALDAVYGGGNQASYAAGTPVVTVHNCDNSIGYVYGGGNAAHITNGNTDVTIYGGNKIGNVFGGGNGTVTAANVSGNTNVKIYGGTIGKVFGGSNSQGNIGGTINVTVTKGGEADTDPDGSSTACAMYINEVYGGGNMAASQAGSITIGCTGNEGEGIGDVYGGANQADITGDITLNISGGSINRVFGGNNTSGDIDGKIQVDVNWDSSLNCGYNYLGSVFGGGNQAAYGSTSANKGDYPVVNIKKANIANNVFGGGLGATAIVYGNPQVTIGNLTTSKTVDIANDVYGGGDAAAVVGTPVVKVINNCYNEIGNVYGGGNAADVNGTDVTIDGGIIDTVFGGGHGDKHANPQKAANVNGDVSLSITGGRITSVFGGSNSKGDISGDITLDINKGDTSCEMHIGEVYGGGNEAAGNSGTISIGCTGDYENNHEGIGDVYGGANAADVNNSIALTISGGHINRVFGGNNTSGSIAGSIQVNVKWNDNSTCGDNYLGSVYGGGNQAAYSNSGNYPEVNIINGTVTNNVFGGGLGQTATVAANPYVHVTGGSIGGNVFGGGDQAAVTGSTNVEINGSNVTVGGKAFGGGNNAGVSVNAVLSLASGSVSGGVYGGCNTTGTIGGNTQVNVTGGTVGATDAHANVHGGGYGQGTAVSGNVTVNIGTQNAATGATIYGDIYGGSAMGTVNTAYNASTHTTYETTTVNLYSGTIDGNVYGGGLGTSSIPAYVYGNAEVYQNGAILISRTQDDPEIAGLKIPVSGMIFGCNNVNGTPKGHVKVVVTKTTGIGDQQMSSAANKATTNESDHTYHMLAVFGGGNQAAYEPDSNTESTEVVINGCNEVSIHTVYGGGNAASTPATSVSVSGAYEIEYVFGGGNGAGTGNPGANVGYRAYPDSVAGPVQVSAREGYAYGTGVAATNIYGGRIHKVFGGSNTKGNVRSSSMAMLDEVSDCPLILDGFYGGGKSAYMEGKGNIHLGCISGLAEIYGGAEKADVGSSIVLTLTSGHYNKVYGGNNISGMVMGSITINIEQTGCLPITIDELFGGGNNAPYSVYGYNSDKSIKLPGDGVTREYDDPVINILSCQSIGTVFGGGEGLGATLVGNPHINVNIVKGWVDGQNATYSTPQELANDGVIGTIYGGGKKAKVIGDTYIFIADQETVEMQSLKDLKTKINSSTGSEPSSTITFGVTGSGDTEAITYTKSGESTASLTKTIIQTVNGATINGNVYGGGNEADITGSSHIKIGPEGQPQQQGGTQGGAPIRSEQPADQPQQPAQPQDPANGNTNGATESLRNNDANLRRL